MKSNRPLRLPSNWRTVMPSPPGTAPGSHWSIVSSRPTVPSSTSCSRTVATNGLAMLPVRKAVSVVTGVEVARSATPAAATSAVPSTRRSTATPGTPLRTTSSMLVRSAAPAGAPPVDDEAGVVVALVDGAAGGLDGAVLVDDAVAVGVGDDAV